MASGVTDASAKTAPTASAIDELRELTPRAIVLGIILAVILGAANAYLGLYAGLTVSASIPAAVRLDGDSAHPRRFDHSRKQRRADRRLGGRGGRGGRHLHVSRAGDSRMEGQPAVPRCHGAVPRGRNDGQPAGGVPAPRLHRGGKTALSGGRRMRRGAARRSEDRQRRAAALRRHHFGAAENLAGYRGLRPRHVFRRAMDRRRRNRGLDRRFGRAAWA